MPSSGIPTFAQFQQLLRGTPMAGEARGIYNASLRGGINPAFVAGLAMAESSGGKAGYAVGTHNPFGLGVHEGWTFPTYAAATERLGRTLHDPAYLRLYQQSGARGVIGRYTPWGDAGNNPDNHTSNIERYGSSTGGNASIIYIGKGAGGSVPVEVPVPGNPRRSIASSGRSNAQSLLALAPEILGTNPNDPLFQLATQGRGAAQPVSAVPAAPGAVTPAAGGAFKQNLNYGSANGVVRPLPTPLGAHDYGYSDPEGQNGHHLAHDWMAKPLTPIASPVNGTVFRVKNDPNPGHQASGQVFGGSVYIQGNDGKVWVFRHVETPEKFLRAGQRVRAGQEIGLVKPWAGPTHTHVELYAPGPYEYTSQRALDPYKYFQMAGIK